MIFINDFLKIKCFGGTHEKEVGAEIEGFPAGLELDMDDILEQLERRRPSSCALVSQRKEDDLPIITSGIKNGVTSGEIIRVSFENRDLKDAAFDSDFIPRPGHGDYSHYKNSGRFIKGASSARSTVAVVFAGALCRQLLSEKGIFISSCLLYPDEKRIEEAMLDGDSVGALVSARVHGLYAGFGNPEEGRLESVISSCIFNIPGVKALEFGMGIEAAFMKGSEFNDAFVTDGKGGATIATNRCGGLLGGLACGTPLELKVSFKPTPSIHKEQQSVDLKSGESVKLKLNGRYDPCIGLRGRVVLEAAIAIALSDVILSNG